MKENTHPEYYPEAKIKCACGNEFTVGSTKKQLHVEVCSACHPFYTGKSKYIDTEGRVEKFEKKREEAELRARREEKKRKKEEEERKRREREKEETPTTLKEMLEKVKE